jgi:hypothetical protein
MDSPVATSAGPVSGSNGSPGGVSGMAGAGLLEQNRALEAQRARVDEFENVVATGGYEITVGVDPELPEVYADPETLRRPSFFSARQRKPSDPANKSLSAIMSPRDLNPNAPTGDSFPSGLKRLPWNLP